MLPHDDISAVVDRREKLRHHSIDEIYSAVRQVITANEAFMADWLLVVIDVSTKSVIELLLTSLPGVHNFIVLRA